MDDLVQTLKNEGYDVIAPVLRDQAIMYDSIDSTEELSRGIIDQQDAGQYRVTKTESGHFFDFTVGPDSAKRFLFPPRHTFWKGSREGQTIKEIKSDEKPPKFAFIGLRACEIKAIEIQDKVFCGGDYQDRDYADRRKNIFVVAVNCGRAVDTCFCTSMNSGPETKSGYDLALTEIDNEKDHYFVLDVGSELGAKLISKMNLIEATNQQQELAKEIVKQTEHSITRKLDSDKAPAIIGEAFNHPYWEEIGKKCLNCANCTLVCPTCFCTSIDDVTDLGGKNAERIRRWDSCFTIDYSYIHGGAVRKSASARYRQWVTHKLSSWTEQFGTSGCVGCGRCISWCPVGIDITETARTILENEQTATGKEK